MGIGEWFVNMRKRMRQIQGQDFNKQIGSKLYRDQE